MKKINHPLAVFFLGKWFMEALILLCGLKHFHNICLCEAHGFILQMSQYFLQNLIRLQLR